MKDVFLYLLRTVGCNVETTKLAIRELAHHAVHCNDLGDTSLGTESRAVTATWSFT